MNSHLLRLENALATEARYFLQIYLPDVLHTWGKTVFRQYCPTYQEVFDTLKRFKHEDQKRYVEVYDNDTQKRIECRWFNY